MPDPIFADPHLAEIYDDLDGDRVDLDLYVSLAAELGARSVLDVGCGTGSLAVRLAAAGLEVTGVDPAAASLVVARRKPLADRVRWIEGDATAVPALAADLAVMTGNVAQVFLGDDEWRATLLGIARAQAPSGWLAFESRDPAREAWREWTPERSFRRTTVPGVGTVESWVDTLEVALPLVTFRWTLHFRDEGVVRTSDSTLRFRTLEELRASLTDCGYSVEEVRDAPDRPGREWVVLARRRPGGGRRW